MKKNKFVVFILSFIPGLGHLYLGLAERAIIFFTALFCLIFGVLGISYILGGRIIVILGLLLPILWFVGLVDSISLVDKINEAYAKSSINSDNINSNDNLSVLFDNTNNKKYLTILFSLVPGAGHMYLGMQKKGIILMASFFLSLFLMGWLNMSLFMVILPVLWFYSLFDALNKFDDKKYTSIDNDDPYMWVEKNLKIVGWGLIILGLFIIIDKLILPNISFEIKSYIQTIVVAGIFIFGGIKLIISNKKNNDLNNVNKIAQNLPVKNDKK